MPERDGYEYFRIAQVGPRRPWYKLESQWRAVGVIKEKKIGTQRVDAFNEIVDRTRIEAELPASRRLGMRCERDTGEGVLVQCSGDLWMDSDGQKKKWPRGLHAGKEPILGVLARTSDPKETPQRH